jgi:hypothetical protein
VYAVRITGRDDLLAPSEVIGGGRLVAADSDLAAVIRHVSWSCSLPAGLAGECIAALEALNSAKTGVPVNNPEVRRGGLYCTHPETTSAGWCPDCEQELNLLPVAEKSPNVAEKSPDECSICRGRHGSEVQHACE